MDEKIKEKIEELRNLGKEETELKLWSDLLPNMTDKEKQELFSSLEKEIALITSK